MGRKLGASEDPLLVSVRSGARASMPGMMDTILNLGLNDASVEGLAAKTGNPRFAYDSYRRFVNMYGDVVSASSPRARSATRSTSSSTPRRRRSGQLEQRALRRRPQGPGGPLQAVIKGAQGRRLPAGSHRAAARRDRCGLRLVEQRQGGAYRRKYDIPAEWEPRSTCRRWSSATWVTTRERASLHPHPRPGRTRSMASTS